MKQRPWRVPALLSCSPGLAYLLSYTALGYLPKGGPIHSGLGLPILYIKKMPQKLVQRSIDGRNFSIEVPSSQITPVSVTETDQNTDP